MTWAEAAQVVGDRWLAQGKMVLPPDVMDDKDELAFWDEVEAAVKDGTKAYVESQHPRDAHGHWATKPGVRALSPNEAIPRSRWMPDPWTHPHGAMARFSQEDVAAADRYMGHDLSFQVNQRLRSGAYPQGRGPGAELSTQIDEEITLLDKAFEHAGSIGSPVRVYRATTGPLSRVGLFGHPDKLVGKTFTDRGYTSTTGDLGAVDAPGGLTDVEWHLTVDPRVRGIYGANPGEDELLLERGTRTVIDGVADRLRPDRSSGATDAEPASNNDAMYLVTAHVLPPETP